MGVMFEVFFTAVMRVANRDELQREVVGFTRHLGFDFVAAMAVADHSSEESTFVWVDNTPEAYRASFENLEGARRDPVMQHCKRACNPII